MMCTRLNDVSLLDRTGDRSFMHNVALLLAIPSLLHLHFAPPPASDLTIVAALPERSSGVQQLTTRVHANNLEDVADIGVLSASMQTMFSKLKLLKRLDWKPSDQAHCTGKIQYLMLDRAQKLPSIRLSAIQRDSRSFTDSTSEKEVRSALDGMKMSLGHFEISPASIKSKLPQRCYSTSPRRCVATINLHQKSNPSGRPPLTSKSEPATSPTYFKHHCSIRT